MKIDKYIRRPRLYFFLSQLSPYLFEIAFLVELI